MSSKKATFYDLTPSEVLDGVQQSGLMPTGQYFQLNSYENRVFDIFLEEDMNPPELRSRVIAKFYRPGRWSHAALKEEHDFLAELTQADIPAIAPLKQNNGETLSLQSGVWMALFPKGLGRLPQELNKEQRVQIGKMLARLHNVGNQRPSSFRPYFTAEQYGFKNIDLLQNWVAPEMWSRYEKAADQIAAYLEEVLNPDSFIRIHGDCHLGNLLLLDKKGEKQQFFFVDFDDFCMGPIYQDFWMLLPDTIENAKSEFYDFVEGYEQLSSFPMPELKLFDALRGLRVIHYAAWIARRYSDPTFTIIFPQFRDYTYWAEETENLERIAWSL